METFMDLCLAVHEDKALPKKFVVNEYYDIKAWTEPQMGMTPEF
jgi:hypothetical protein